MSVDLTDVEAALASAPRVRATAAAVRDGRIIGYVVPGTNTAATTAWRNAFQEIYKVPAASDGFDARGWMSSIDGTPLPEADMRAWRDATIAVLREEPVGRVLEIGCGNGLLATELIDECASYVGTDIVAEGIDEVRLRLGSAGGKATLFQMEATDIGALDGPFDLIVLNSVIQYFPDARYLVDVLELAASKLAAGGRIFVGDVRHRGLAEMLYTERALARLSDPTPEKIARVVRVNRTSEGELLVDPRFFGALAHRFGASWSADVAPKRGRFDNELSRYRYEVTMRPPGAARDEPVAVHDWAGGDLETLVAGGMSPVLVRGVANARLGAGLHPEDVYAVAAAHGYRCRLDWSSGAESGAFDVYLSTSGPVATVPADEPPTDVYSLVSPPRLGDTERRYADAIDEHVRALLPDHLVPERIVVLNALPVDRRGGVDRDALPDPL